MELSLSERFLRRFIRLLSKIAFQLLARTTFIGLENLEVEGPVIYAANHPSAFDGAFFFGYLPTDTQFVGPGDFRLKWPNRIGVENTGMILVNRGYPDRKALQGMVKVLKGGGRLALFPEGGTWEKGFFQVKPGVAFLSMTTKAKIVPISISGTYDIWRRMRVLKFPRVRIEVGKALPPVVVKDRKNRETEFEQANQYMMQIIYDMLTDEERARYAHYDRMRYHGKLEIISGSESSTPADEFTVIPEVISKKNLFSTFHEHAGLPVYPFLNNGKVYSAQAFKAAVDSLSGALHGGYSGYISFRLGEAKAGIGLKEIQRMQEIVDRAQQEGAKIRFHVEITQVPVEDTPSSSLESGAEDNITTLEEELVADVS